MQTKQFNGGLKVFSTTVIFTRYIPDLKSVTFYAYSRNVSLSVRFRKFPENAGCPLRRPHFLKHAISN